jgi:hypothetical protein
MRIKGGKKVGCTENKKENNRGVLRKNKVYLEE